MTSTSSCAFFAIEVSDHYKVHIIYTIYCNICLSLSSAGMPLPFGAHPSRSPARSSLASVMPVKDGRFLGLGQCII